MNDKVKITNTILFIICPLICKLRQIVDVHLTIQIRNGEKQVLIIKMNAGIVSTGDGSENQNETCCDDPSIVSHVMLPTVC